jgi:hypothetical protein
MHDDFPKSPDEIMIIPEWADEKKQAAEELNARRALIREDVLKERKRLADEEAVTQMQQANRADPEYLDDSVDWWVKYLASQGKAEAMRKYRGNVLTLFNKELERVFDMSEGAVSKFELFRGRGEEELAVGIFKGNVSVVTDVDNVAVCARGGDHIVMLGRNPRRRLFAVCLQRCDTPPFPLIVLHLSLPIAGLNVGLEGTQKTAQVHRASVYCRGKGLDASGYKRGM